MKTPKYIAQGLLRSWKQAKESDSSSCKTAPLIYYLEYNYNERHVKLCERLGVTPLSFGKWLSKPIESVI